MSLVSSFAPPVATRRRIDEPTGVAARLSGSQPRQQPTVRLYSGEGERLLRGAGLIVTPNLDHLRLLAISKAFRHAYAQADAVVNDSHFLDRLALIGRVPCLPGSELAPAMLDFAAAGSRVVLIGGDARVRAYLSRAYLDLEFTFLDPSMGYIRKRRERRALSAAVLRAKPDQVFVCTGAPQSELMAAQLKRDGCTADILCCGAAFNFLCGAKTRAPQAFRTLGAEWLWRFVGEAHTRKRYAADIAFLLRRLPAFQALRATGRAVFDGFGLNTD